MKHVDVREVGQVIILTPKRSLLGDDETFELEGLIHRFDNEGNRYLVVSLANVRRLNSIGLGVLIGAHNLYSARGAKISFCRLDERLEKILTLTRLRTVMDIHGSVQEAMAGIQDDQVDGSGLAVLPARWARPARKSR